MCLRQSREPKSETGEDRIDEDPIRFLREPPGALGDIVRRMKGRASERRVTRMLARDDPGYCAG